MAYMSLSRRITGTELSLSLYGRSPVYASPFRLNCRPQATSSTTVSNTDELPPDIHGLIINANTHQRSPQQSHRLSERDIGNRQAAFLSVIGPATRAHLSSDLAMAQLPLTVGETLIKGKQR